MINVKIKRIDSKAILPSYANPGDAGMDIHSMEDKRIYPGETVLIKTGLCIEIPENYEAQIRPRSGLALNNGITVLNSPGTIDSGYRGEIKIILINHSGKLFEIKQGMRIAQMVISPIIRAEIIEVISLVDSERGQGGFGSTGV